MITAWILYATVVGALFGGSALALEKFLRTHSLPSRWVWVGAILLSVGWPVGHWAWESQSKVVPAVVESGPSAIQVPGPSPVVLPLETITVEVPPESILRVMDGPVLVAWAFATSLLCLFFTFLLLRTHRLRARWREGEAGGHPVLYSDDWGPAVVGVLRPQIVLPAWCQELDGGAMGFILDHEVEHLRAGDLRLLGLTGIFPILFPWHLPLWWQFSRLRTAAESDCDQRVLGRNPGQTRSYVHLLLEVGERASRYRPLTAMLSEPYDTLKRRIRIMTMPFPTRPWLRGGLLTGAGAILVAMACWAPEPTEVGSGEDPAATIPPAAQEATASAPGEFLPVFTPYSVRPSLQNPDEVIAFLEQAYPTELKEAGIGGTVDLWFFLDETGTLLRVMVAESSGNRELDNTAIRVGESARFNPAMTRDRTVPVWVSLPVEFIPGSGVGLADAEAPGQPVGGRILSASNRTPTRLTNQEGSVMGRVLDASTGEPLSFAQVFVENMGLGTLTDEDGRFSLAHVPPGEMDIVVHLMGFVEERARIDVVAGEEARVPLQLAPQAIGMNKLVVVGGAGLD